MKKYDLHIGRLNYFGSEDPITLKDAIAQAEEYGIEMVILPAPIPDGLWRYEIEHPEAAVIFNIETEDVVAVEKP